MHIPPNGVTPAVAIALLAIAALSFVHMSLTDNRKRATMHTAKLDADPVHQSSPSPPSAPRYTPSDMAPTGVLQTVNIKKPPQDPAKIDDPSAVEPRDPWIVEWLQHLLDPRLIAAFVAGWFSYRSWRLKHITDKWYELVKYMADNAKYVDPQKTVNYKDNYKDDELVKYEMAARMCIAFLDDMYFLRFKGTGVRRWFCGLIELFAGRHRKWLEDHRSAYDGAFYSFLQEELRKCDEATSTQ